MLVHLGIRNLATIEETSVSFDPQLNIVTGTTGAGKSVLIEALGLVMGARANGDTVRHGADRAEVEAILRLARNSNLARTLEESDFLDSDDHDSVEVVIRRIIRREGRSRVYINGRITTLGFLTKIMGRAVEISSQHEQTELLDPTRQLGLLDRYADLDETLNAYTQAWNCYRDTLTHLDELRSKEQERIKEEDYVRYQLEEIRTIDPQPDEEARIETERRRLVHAEDLARNVFAVEQTLHQSERSADVALSEAGRAIGKMVSLDPSLEKLAQRIESLRLELIDVAGDVSHYGRDIEPNPERLALLDERLGALERLKRKHGGELTDVIDHAKNLESSLDMFENLEEAMIAAQNATDAAYQAAFQQAQALSTARRTAADVLEQVVATQLTDLAMKEAALSISLEPGDSLTAHGIDQGEFLVRTNPGEPFRALSRVASGGEISRLLLAMKRALCQTEETHCLVFDEVDTGVGGAVAEVVGLKLREISQEKQVIAITHLPQIAALGDHHALVMKHQDGHRARTEVQGLDHSQRTAELARMLGGRTISDQTWAHAAELLRASHHAAAN